MTDAPKTRPWLQFHLSTAVVLMFVAAGLLWANMLHRHEQLNEFDACLQDMDRMMAGTAAPTVTGKIAQGFPCVVLRTRIVDGTSSGPLGWPEFSLSALVCDVLVGLLMLVGTAILLEWRVRRKERAHD